MLNQKIVISGKWWLPEDPTNKISGELTYIPGSIIQLNLIGSFNYKKKGSGETEFTFNLINPSIIYGLGSPSGQKVTLINCQQSEMSGFSLHATSAFIVDTVFLNYHLPENPTFSSVNVGFTNLESWVKRNPIKHNSVNGFNKLDIRFTKPPDIEIELPDFILKLICLGPNVEDSVKQRTSISYSYNFMIVPCIGINISEYLKIIRKIQRFLGIAMGSPTFPNVINCIYENSGKVYLVEVLILLADWFEEGKYIHPPEMLFTLPRSSRTFTKYLRNWFINYENIKPAIDRYFTVFHNPDEYNDAKFLILAQGIESFHRRLFDGKFMTEEKYKEIIEKPLIECLPKNINIDLSDSLFSRIHYGNEYSLKKRLNGIIENCKNVLPFKYIDEKSVRDDFIVKVKNTRNYFTHYEKSLEKKAIKSGPELFALVNQIYLLLETCLLKVIVGDKKKIQNMIKKSHRYRIVNYFE